MEHKFYDLIKMDEIAQGDENFIKDMVVTFVENVTEDIGKIRSARSVEDWKTIGEVAHKMASRFAYLDADSLQTLAGDIEKSVLIEKNLDGIAEKADKLCSDSILLIEQLKQDFDYLNTNHSCQIII